MADMKTEIAKKEKRKKEKPTYNLWQNTAYMIGRAWRERKSVLFLCLALMVLMVAINLTELFLSPVILGKVEASAPLPELLGTIAVFAAALMLLSGLRAYCSANTIFGRIELRVNGIVGDIVQKQLTTSYPNTEDEGVLKKLEKANQATNSNSQATEAIWGVWTDLLRDLIGFGIYLFLLSHLDPLLMGIVLVTSAAAFVANNRINGWGWRHREEEAAYSRQISYITNRTSDIPLAKDIRIFGMRPWLEEVYQNTWRLYNDFFARREKVYLWTDVISVAASLLRGVAAYAYLIALTLREGLPASQFLLYFTAVNGFSSWVTGILSGFSTLKWMSANICEVRDYLETPEPFRFEDGEPLQADPKKAYELRLQDVSFRYPGAEADTIHRLTLTIRPGEKLAIVGLNGAGKTTLVKLLCGFYDPTEGAVLLDGVDIRRYNRRDYYTLFAAVFQQFSVLEATVAENVAQVYAGPGKTAASGIDIKKVCSCLEQAGLTEKIESLPKKEQTYIGRQVFEDGVELSGGQMQRLMLARALYKNAPVIVLDEPTAALDPIAEHDIYRKYHALTAGRTSLFISHRLASTRFCDRILFLEQGAVAEEGTHEELLAAGGKYAELFAVQSKYYQEGSDPNV